MSRIKLLNGGYTLVDKDDYLKFRNYRWRKSSHGYVIAYSNKKMLRLHREIMDAKSGVQVDHINLNKLDNRKNNLRLCNNSQNHMNFPMRSDKRVGKYKGVHKNDSRYSLPWYASIGYSELEKKQMRLGNFKTQEEAAYVYDQFAMQLAGEFARTNHTY